MKLKMLDGSFEEVLIGVNGPSINQLWVLEHVDYQQRVKEYLKSVDNMDLLIKADPFLYKLYNSELRQPTSNNPSNITTMHKIENVAIIESNNAILREKLSREQAKIKARSFKITLGIAEDLEIALKDIKSMDLTDSNNLSTAYNLLARTFKLTETSNTSKDNDAFYFVLNIKHISKLNPIEQDKQPTYDNPDIESSAIHPSWFKCNDAQNMLTIIIMSYVYHIYLKRKKDIAIFQADMLWVTNFIKKIRTSKFNNQRTPELTEYLKSKEAYQLIRAYTTE